MHLRCPLRQKGMLLHKIWSYIHEKGNWKGPIIVDLEVEKLAKQKKHVQMNNKHILHQMSKELIKSVEIALHLRKFKCYQRYVECLYLFLIESIMLVVQSC